MSDQKTAEQLAGEVKGVLDARLGEVKSTLDAKQAELRGILDARHDEIKSDLEGKHDKVKAVPKKRWAKRSAAKTSPTPPRNWRTKR